MVFFIFLLAFINFNAMRLLFLFVGLRICPSDFCRTQNLSGWFLWDSEFIRVIFVGLRIYPSDFCGTRSRHDWVGAPVPRSVSLNLVPTSSTVVYCSLSNQQREQQFYYSSVTSSSSSSQSTVSSTVCWLEKQLPTNNNYILRACLAASRCTTTYHTPHLHHQ